MKFVGEGSGTSPAGGGQYGLMIRAEEGLRAVNGQESSPFEGLGCSELALTDLHTPVTSAGDGTREGFQEGFLGVGQLGQSYLDSLWALKSSRARSWTTLRRASVLPRSRMKPI
jgi:hypothetical protein